MTKHNEYLCESRRRDVHAEGREPTHQRGVCPQAKLTESVAATSRRSGTSTRRARVVNDQAVVRASDGERDRVKFNTSEAWTVGAFTRNRRQQCMEPSSNVANTMKVSDQVNKIEAVFNDLFSSRSRCTCSIESTPSSS